ncbi:MAG TPA: hypothetical protein VK436_03870 [Methanocella sp.]|nr:hypothetical protein [Methanocella sp.]
MPGDANYCPGCGYTKTGPYLRADLRGARRAARYAYKSERRAGRAAGRAWRRRLWASPEWGLLNAITAGMFVVFLGGLFFLAASKAIDQVTWSSVWMYILVAIGSILVLRGVARLIIFQNFFGMWSIFTGLVMAAIGIAGLTSSLFPWGFYLWPTAFVLGGALIIVAGVCGYLLKIRLPQN